MLHLYFQLLSCHWAEKLEFENELHIIHKYRGSISTKQTTNNKLQWP